MYIRKRERFVFKFFFRFLCEFKKKGKGAIMICKLVFDFLLFMLHVCLFASVVL